MDEFEESSGNLRSDSSRAGAGASPRSRLGESGQVDRAGANDPGLVPPEEVPFVEPIPAETVDRQAPPSEALDAGSHEDTGLDARPFPRSRDEVPEGRTPPDITPLPVPLPEGGYDLDDPTLFLNRELTWLNFNFRVLHEADDSRVPLLERLKFISIVSSNLDEFFMKRIGGLKQQVGARVLKLTVDGRSPERQIEECATLVRTLEERKRNVLARLLPELESAGIAITTYPEVSLEDQTYLREQYLELIYPLVTPQATDPAHPFPFISNLSLNLLVSLRYRDDASEHLARVKVPVGAGIPRFLPLPNRRTFVTLESVMAHNLDLLFPGMEITACEIFRVTRNSNTEQEEEAADDLVDLIESELRERRFAPIVRLEVEAEMDPDHQGMLAAELGLDEQKDVFERPGLLGMADLMGIATLEIPELRDPPHHPVDHPALTTSRSIFHTILERGSILLSHPYQSYSSSVESFLEEASQDPQVRAIKMTFYRTSEDSKAIGFLMDAARNDKQVAVVMEIKASFDEEANLRLAHRLGSVGIHVTYGVVGLKTHCKLILVVRQDYDGLRRYAHVGTGNYHAHTARFYTDLGLLTVDGGIGRDLTELFNYLTTGYKPSRRYDKIFPAPKGLKAGILKRIKREAEFQSNGTPGLIRIKTNALEDPDVTRALYQASQTGVQIDLVVRDTCRLRPGIPDLSENIKVLSVVGRFLEHGRIYHFGNGGDEEYFIGSADLMRRNLENRVEVLAPVEHPDLRAELRYILDTQIDDERSVWEMKPDGSYVQRVTRKKGNQQKFIDRAEGQHREATRLKRRPVRGLQEGNLPT